MFEEALAGLDHLICYAVKANSNLAVLALMGSLGAGMDVVSEGEYRRARAAGVPGERIVFSGVGKTREEMRLALEGGMRQFNVESEPELEALSEVAAGAGPGGAGRGPGEPRRRCADPRQDRHRQGGEQVRGADRAGAGGLCPRRRALPGIEVVGIDVHIGSQLTELAPYEAAFAKVAELTGVLRADGHAIRRLDLGGGLGHPLPAGATRRRRCPSTMAR